MADDLSSLATSSPIVDMTKLISALSPIFLGTGATTGSTTGSTSGATSGSTTGATTGTTSGSTGQTTVGTATQNLTSGADPAIIANMISQMNKANSLANDPNAVKAIIDNIIHTNLVAFAPTIGEANASGIYNSSTLGLLAGEAAARSTGQAASAALNFKTSEQQIAGNIGAQLLGATKTQQTTGGTTNQQTGTSTTTQDTTQNQTQQQDTRSNTQQDTSQKTAPIVGSSGASNLLLGAGGLAIPFLLNKAGITGEGGLLDKVGLTGDDSLLNRLFGESLTSDTGSVIGGIQPVDTTSGFDTNIGNINIADSLGGGAVGGGLPFS